MSDQNIAQHSEQPAQQNKDGGYARERVKTEEWRIDKYTTRNPTRHQAEMALVQRAFPQLPKGAPVLDAPCGAGRVSLWMAQQGWEVSAMDLGAAAVAYTSEMITGQGLSVSAQEGNIFDMPWNDQHFRAVICFRLIHHFADRDIRRQLVQELARVSGEHVLISYLSPWSATGIKRRLRELFTGKRNRQNHTPLAELVEDLREVGFALMHDTPQRRFFHSLHLARFIRVDR